jgi:16S rRNA processing protein RimM
MTKSAAMRADGSPDDWVVVAVIMRPHGLKGVLRWNPMTRTAEDLIEAPIKSFSVRNSDGLIVAKLTAVELWESQGLVMGTFEEIADRTAAEKLTNMEIVIRQSELWPLGDEEYYINDLQGLDVVDASSGEVLGKVRTAQEGAAHDYLLLRLNALPGKDTMLPLVPQFVPRVSIAEGRVEVIIPPGLVG